MLERSIHTMTVAAPKLFNGLNFLLEFFSLFPKFVAVLKELSLLDEKAKLWRNKFSSKSKCGDKSLYKSLDQ